MIDAALLEDVDLLSLDAGNTVIFLDHERLARLARDAGFPGVTRERLIATEGEAKRLASDATQMVDPAWPERDGPGAAAWGRMVATMLARANVAESALPSLISAIWKSHVDHNLWSLVPEGFADAIARVRSAGVKTVIVSNSEGMLDRLFHKLGIDACFDAVIDSGRVKRREFDARSGASRFAVDVDAQWRSSAKIDALLADLNAHLSEEATEVGHDRRD